MKILVSGGAGFIGSNFIEHLIEDFDGVEIVCIDKLTYAGNLINLQTFISSSRIRFLELDISDSVALFNLLEGETFDYIVNFAAESHVDRSIANPDVFVKSNVIGVMNLLELSRKLGVKRFHQVSTDEVYGDLPIHRLDLSFSETSPLKPSSPYSATKASADLLCLAYQRTYGLDVTISRSSNNYGPFQIPEKLIPLVIDKIFSNEEIPVYGSGENVRDWIFVKDHCIAITTILHKGLSGEIYNVGASNEISNIVLIKKIIKKSNSSEELITFVQDRLGHDQRYSVDSSKLHQLGWMPMTDFEEGINTTLDWYQRNSSWLKHVKEKKQ
jgi:dTDP-glucose 4,6-dehydratase